MVSLYTLLERYFVFGDSNVNEERFSIHSCSYVATCQLRKPGTGCYFYHTSVVPVSQMHVTVAREWLIPDNYGNHIDVHTHTYGENIARTNKPLNVVCRFRNAQITWILTHRVTLIDIGKDKRKRKKWRYRN